MLPTPVSRGRPLQQIPIGDVLEFTAHVLESGHGGRADRIEIASDELSAVQAADTVSQLVGRPVGVADPASGQPLFAWLERVGTHVDIAALRRRFPGIGWHTFADWAATQDWRLGFAADGR
jgi:hypothetical protein